MQVREKSPASRASRASHACMGNAWQGTPCPGPIPCPRRPGSTSASSHRRSLPPVNSCCTPLARVQRLVLRLDGWDQSSHYPHGHLVRVLGPINSLRCGCKRTAAAIRATVLSCASKRGMRLAHRLVHVSTARHFTSQAVQPTEQRIPPTAPPPSQTILFTFLSPIPLGRSETDGVLVSSGVHWQPFRWARGKARPTRQTGDAGPTRQTCCPGSHRVRACPAAPALALRCSPAGTTTRPGHTCPLPCSEGALRELPPVASSAEYVIPPAELAARRDLRGTEYLVCRQAHHLSGPAICCSWPTSHLLFLVHVSPAALGPRVPCCYGSMHLKEACC